MNKNIKEVSELEIVVLLNGNFCVIPSTTSQIESDTKMILECMSKSIEDPKFFLNYKGYFLFAKNILGFYVRHKTVSIQEKGVALLEKLQGNIDDGDSWKNE